MDICRSFSRSFRRFKRLPNNAIVIELENKGNKRLLTPPPMTDVRFILRLPKGRNQLRLSGIYNAALNTG
jgi:hypothetical protein